jgi:hypothetical protein
MDGSENKHRGRDWIPVVAALVAVALLAGAIAYKYTGDFTGLVKFGTREQAIRN